MPGDQGKKSDHQRLFDPGRIINVPMIREDQVDLMRYSNTGTVLPNDPSFNMQQISRPMTFLERLQDAAPGSIIRWVDGRFTYVALKVKGDWYTTATELNSKVDPKMSTFELAAYLTGISNLVLQGCVQWIDLSR